MNEEIYNIGYDALQTIMQLCCIARENIENEYDTGVIIAAIQKIAIQSKYMMFQKKEEANN